jgi:predicted metal-dependent phosphoesterase TrpH
MWVKADFHAHCKGDPCDTDLRHTPEQAIDKAAALGYKVFCITCHTKVLYSRRLARYAARKGVLLVPGAELRVEGRDVLAYNLTDREAQRLTTFKDLHRWRKPRHLLIAPHPFYPDTRPHSLHNHLADHIDLFDAIEWCHCYTSWLNPFNPKAARAAREHGLPLVGTSDSHALWQLNGRNHTLIDLPRNPAVADVVRAVRQGRVRLVTRPLPLGLFLKTLAWIARGTIHGYVHRTWRRPRQPL